MFSVDDLVADCRSAVREGDARLAVRDVLDRALSDRSAMIAALPAERAGIAKLHADDEVTVIQVVWAPGMSIRPHDHRMWAAIAIYGGQEDNAFYRRAPGGLVESGGKVAREGDVLLLGDDAIHSVTNPLTSYTAAIHVYGGDFFTQPRSEWTADTFEEMPYDVATTMRTFEEANARLAGRSNP